MVGIRFFIDIYILVFLGTTYGASPIETTNMMKIK